MLECIPQIVVRFEEVRFETDGLLIVSHGFRPLTLLTEDIAQVVVRFGVVGYKPDGLLILCHRFHIMALIAECNA